MRAGARVLAFTLLSGLLGASRSARADEKDRCAVAAETAQDLRAANRFREARKELLVCARDVCPRVVRVDCVRWLDEVDRTMPSIAVQVVDPEGRDVVRGRLLVDGFVVRESLDGASIPLDPGPHKVRYEGESGNAQLDVMAVQGERDKRVKLLIARPAEKPMPLRPPKEPPPGKDPGADLRTAAYVAGGIGALGIVAFGVLELLAQSQYRDLKNGCGQTRTCSTSEVSALRTKFIGAGIGLGVGVLGFGTAFTLLLWPTAEPTESGALTPAFGVGVAFDRPRHPPVRIWGTPGKPD